MNTERRVTLPRLLVVEDDAVMRRAMCSALCDAGYSPIECADLTAARSALSRATADLIVLDLSFHDEFATGLLDELARSTSRPEVVVCSGFPLAPIVAARYGVACLMKPFDLERLIEHVERALGARTPALS